MLIPLISVLSCCQRQLAELESAPVTPNATGTMNIRLVRATGLRSADSNGLSDPYVKLTIAGSTQKSKIIKKTLNPTFDETFQFHGTFSELVKVPLQIIVLDHDVTSFDDMLGISTVDLAEAEAGREFYPGKDKDFRAELDTMGTVFLKAWWASDDAESLSDQDSTWSSRILCVFTLGLSRLCKGNAKSRNVAVVQKGPCRYIFGRVIHPDSRFRSAWNVALAFFICYCGIGVPLEIAFEADMVDAMCGVGEAKLLRADCPDFQLWFWANFVVDMWFICDIIINFRTGYVTEGHFVSDDWLAAKKYLRGSFIMDCFGTFPLNILLMIINPDNPYGDLLEDVDTGDATGGGTDVGRVNRMLRLLRMAKLAKLARMAKLAKYMENFEEFLNPGVLTVIKLVLVSLFCCHWFGCLWWLVSDLETSIDTLESPLYAGFNNWQPPEWLKKDADLMSKYSHAFFWGAGMVTSLVPRDIEPITSLEAFVTTFTMFFGLLLNAFVISSLTQALASMDSKKELVGKQLGLMKNYLVLKAVPSDLRSRILDYHEYLFTSSAAFADMNMFENMPPALTAQLNLSTNRKLVTRCGLFRDVANSTLIALLAELHPLVAVPGQLITVEGNQLEAAFFIHRGRVQLKKEDVKELPRVILNNDNFGMDDFVAGYMSKKVPVSSFTARAVTYCDLETLTVETLSDALNRDPSFADALKRRRLSKAATGNERRISLGKWKNSKGRMGGSNSGRDEGSQARAACLRLAARIKSSNSGSGASPSGADGGADANGDAKGARGSSPAITIDESANTSAKPRLSHEGDPPKMKSALMRVAARLDSQNPDDDADLAEELHA